MELSKSLISGMVLILNIEYSKCPKILNTLFHNFFFFFCIKFAFYAVVLKMLSGMAVSVDPDQTAPEEILIWVYTVCICYC